MTTKLKNLVLLLILLTLAGCSSIEKIEQPLISDFTILSNENTFGQTYVARYDGLDGFQIYVEPELGAQGVVHLQLSEGPGENNVLRTATIDLADISSPGYIRFQFPPVKDSTQKYYYIRLETEGAGSLRVGTSAGDSYINGAMYQNQIPRDAQLAFNLSYEPIRLASGLLREGLTWILWVLIGIFLYIIPGWALLGLLWPGWGNLHWGEKLGLSAGVSLAIYPLIFLWTHLIGLNLGPLYAWIPPIVGVLIIIWNNRKDLKRRRISSPIPLSPFPWSDITLLFVIGLIFAVRFWVIRGLDAPLWGDSYQHTMIAQLLVDNNGLFNSWEPYAELTTFTYHFGFHTLVAVFHWITRIPVIPSVLWTGQILNGLAVISIYPLAVRIGKNQIAGIVAVLFAGLLSMMPMYYVNWGRYTQLAGLVILPAVVYLTWSLLDAEKIDWRRYVLPVIALSGLALTHYRVFIFALCFEIAFIILSLSFSWFKVYLKREIIALSFTFLLILPWIIQIFSGRMIPNYSQLFTKSASVFIQQYNSISSNLSFLPTVIWIILPLIIGWGLWSRKKEIALLCMWWSIIFLITNPQWLKLPGAGLISNFAVIISLYIPVGILIGSVSTWIIDTIRMKPIITDIQRESERKLVLSTITLVTLIIIVLLSLVGIQERRKDLRVSDHSLVTRPDIQAAEWIRENTSSNSKYLVNSFFAFGNTTMVGSDGGWWVPILGLRDSLLPPVTYGIEHGYQSDYAFKVNSIFKNLEENGISDPLIYQLLREQGTTHIYVGQRQGSVNSGGAAMKITDLLESPFYQVVYNKDRVWIFEVKK